MSLLTLVPELTDRGAWIVQLDKAISSLQSSEDGQDEQQGRALIARELVDGQPRIWSNHRLRIGPYDQTEKFHCPRRRNGVDGLSGFGPSTSTYSRQGPRDTRARNVAPLHLPAVSGARALHRRRGHDARPRAVRVPRQRSASGVPRAARIRGQTARATIRHNGCRLSATAGSWLGSFRSLRLRLGHAGLAGGT